MRISTKLSPLLDRKFSRSTGRSINPTVLLCFNQQQTRKQEGWKTDDYMTLLQWILLIEQEANLQLIVVGQCLTLTSIPVNVVAKCKEHVNR